MKSPAQTPAQFYKWLRAYASDAKFAHGFDTMYEVWEACPRADWMLRMLKKLDKTPGKDLARFALWCVRNTPLGDGRTVWDLLDDKRSRAAIEVAERFLDGDATRGELDNAADAAHAAYCAAYYAARHAGCITAGHAGYIAAKSACYAIEATKAGYIAGYIAAKTARAAIDVARIAVHNDAKDAKGAYIIQIIHVARVAARVAEVARAAQAVQLRTMIPNPFAE